MAGDYQQAAADLDLAAKICAEHDYAEGQRTALNYLASVQQEAGDYPAARENFRTALDLCVALRDRHAEAAVANSLCYLQCLTGQVTEAITGLERTLEMHREVGTSATLTIRSARRRPATTSAASTWRPVTGTVPGRAMARPWQSSVT